MLAPATVILALAASGALFLLLSYLLRSHEAWRVLALAALALAGLRSCAIVVGTHLLGSSGGWVQLPAFGLTLLALPELALAGRPESGAFGVWLVTVVALVSLGSVAWVLAVGGLVLAARRRRGHRP